MESEGRCPSRTLGQDSGWVRGSRLSVEVCEGKFKGLEVTKRVCRGFLSVCV